LGAEKNSKTIEGRVITVPDVAADKDTYPGLAEVIVMAAIPVESVFLVVAERVGVTIPLDAKVTVLPEIALL
jgi:hypothetical protein